MRLSVSAYLVVVLVFPIVRQTIGSAIGRYQAEGGSEVILAEGENHLIRTKRELDLDYKNIVAATLLAVISCAKDKLDEIGLHPRQAGNAGPHKVTVTSVNEGDLANVHDVEILNRLLAGLAYQAQILDANSSIVNKDEYVGQGRASSDVFAPVHQEEPVNVNALTNLAALLSLQSQLLQNGGEVSHVVGRKSNGGSSHSSGSSHSGGGSHFASSHMGGTGHITIGRPGSSHVGSSHSTSTGGSHVGSGSEHASGNSHFHPFRPLHQNGGNNDGSATTNTDSGTDLDVTDDLDSDDLAGRASNGQTLQTVNTGAVNVVGLTALEQLLASLLAQAQVLDTGTEIVNHNGGGYHGRAGSHDGVVAPVEQKGAININALNELLAGTSVESQIASAGGSLKNVFGRARRIKGHNSDNAPQGRSHDPSPYEAYSYTAPSPPYPYYLPAYPGNGYYGNYDSSPMAGAVGYNHNYVYPSQQVYYQG